MSGGIQLRAAGNRLAPASSTVAGDWPGQDKELVAGGLAPEQTLPMAALSVSIPAPENNGQGRKGSADPSSGNFTSPFASKGTCVLEFGQGGGSVSLLREIV